LGLGIIFFEVGAHGGSEGANNGGGNEQWIVFFWAGNYVFHGDRTLAI